MFSNKHSELFYLLTIWQDILISSILIVASFSLDWKIGTVVLIFVAVYQVLFSYTHIPNVKLENALKAIDNMKEDKENLDWKLKIGLQRSVKGWVEVLSAEKDRYTWNNKEWDKKTVYLVRLSKSHFERTDSLKDFVKVNEIEVTINQKVELGRKTENDSRAISLNELESVLKDLFPNFENNLFAVRLYHIRQSVGIPAINICREINSSA